MFVFILWRNCLNTNLYLITIENISEVKSNDELNANGCKIFNLYKNESMEKSAEEEDESTYNVLFYFCTIPEYSN